MQMRETEYADIVLPVALRPLTYRTGELALRPGMAVVVGIGPRKLCQGIVWRLHDDAPRFPTRAVEKVLYGAPLLTHQQMRFWEWVAQYYMCSLGEVMAMAVPAALKPQGFSPLEFAGSEFRVATEMRIGLDSSLGIPEKLGEALDTLRRKAPSQYKAMVEVVEKLEAAAEGFPSGGVSISRKALKADLAILKKLSAKGLITIIDVAVQGGGHDSEPALAPPLPPSLKAAAAMLTEQFSIKQTVLLRGAVDDEKRALCIHFAARELAMGRNVLWLVPGMAPLRQLASTLGETFDGKLALYHSGLTARQRAEVYLSSVHNAENQSDTGRLVLGTRIAAFLPMNAPGLIIVEGEHDAGFKQDSPAPRFHGRDCALALASICGAQTLLCSATPSLESWYNVQTGKYGLVALASQVPPPPAVISDTTRALRRTERRAHFNKEFLDGITATLAAGGQAIVFQNRRGFAPWVACEVCGWVATCPSCNVSLAYHKARGALLCHYCGHSAPLPASCPSCRGQTPKPHGYGTEKLEEDLTRLFPEAHVARLDSDTAAGVSRARRIISDFKNLRTNILVGTQMALADLGFPDVGFVGVVNADNMLSRPDFRASERAFHILTRAMTCAPTGETVIQTSQPENNVLLQAARGDYDAMAREQLEERRAFLYPPFSRLILLTFKHHDETMATAAASHLAALLHPQFGNRLVGPGPPPVDKVMDEHITTLLLKIPRGESFGQAKAALAAALEATARHAQHKKVKIICNVDPQ